MNNDRAPVCPVADRPASGLAGRLRHAIDDPAGFGLVEALVAVTVLVIGLLAVSGLTLTTAAQARIADLRTDQSVAAQMAFEQMRFDGFANAESGVDTVVTGGREFIVTTVVTEVNGRTKAVAATVAAASGGLTERTYTTALHAPRSLPPEENPLDP